MKYVVPISGGESLFHLSEQGLESAKELAIAENSQVFIEDNGERQEQIFPVNKLIKIKHGS